MIEFGCFVRQLMKLTNYL